jgi:hypothetical protein
MKVARHEMPGIATSPEPVPKGTVRLVAERIALCWELKKAWRQESHRSLRDGSVSGFSRHFMPGYLHLVPSGQTHFRPWHRRAFAESGAGGLTSARARGRQKPGLSWLDFTCYTRPGSWRVEPLAGCSSKPGPMTSFRPAHRPYSVQRRCQSLEIQECPHTGFQCKGPS